MQKMVKDNIIFVDKPKMSVVPLVLSAASLLFVALGAASLFYFQQPLQETQDVRNDASVGNGQVLLTSQLTSSPIFTSGTPSTVELKYNSQGVQLTGIQIVTKVTANAETPTIEVPANSNLQAVFQEIEQTTGGYLVSMIITPKTLGQSFSSTSPVTFAKLTVPLRSAGQISLVYDKANSFATVANTNPPKDELRTPEDVTFSIVSSSSPTPSPTPSPSPSPSVSPSVTPTPTPNPLGDDFWIPTEGNYLTFYTNDSARTEVALADLVPYRTYRVKVQYQVQNAKKSSTPDQSPIQTALVFNSQGSSYVTSELPYSLIANHRDGAASSVETVFSTLPDNTLRITTDSRNAYSESNESNNALLLTFKADNGVGGSTTSGTCNKYCADSSECQTGFTCFYNQCRRPDNPDNSSCAVPSTTIASSIAASCNKGCNSNKDCAVNLRCYQGACRLATNPSSLTCAAATAGVISKGTGTRLAGEKGEVIPVPTGSPTPTVSPVSSPRTSIAPAATPVGQQPTTEEQPLPSFLTNLISSWQARGISLPLVAVGAGIVLFILALIFAILGRTKNRPPMVVPARKEPPKSAYEDDLQRKINSLKTQAEQPQPIRPFTPAPPVPPTPPAAPPAGSGMMSRLRERGVLDQMAEAEKQTPPTPPSA
jgi:hypothetical protein